MERQKERDRDKDILKNGKAKKQKEFKKYRDIERKTDTERRRERETYRVGCCGSVVCQVAAVIITRVGGR